MKKLVVWTLLAVMFFATLTAGCGGGSSSDSGTDSEQTESLYEDTGDYDPNGENRGTTGATIDISALSEDYTAQDGETLTGTVADWVKISIADGAAVTLKNAKISREDDYSYPQSAGITCEGNATLILKGTNSVKSFHPDYPGIHVPKGKTLTIKGSGSLNASGKTFGAGIGGGWGMSRKGISCGNIVIDGGTIYATGTRWAAGIGGGADSDCGYITITKNVTRVTATKGEDAPYSIGAGDGGSCGTVTIGGKVGSISDDQYTYPPDMQ